MNKIGNIVYLSTDQYTELIDNGSLTVGDTTINYSDNDIYITPDKGYTVVKVNGEEVNEWDADEYVNGVVQQYTNWYRVANITNITSEEFHVVYDNVSNDGIRTSIIRDGNTGNCYQILGVGDNIIVFTNGHNIYKAVLVDGVVNTTFFTLTGSEGSDLTDYYDKAYIDEKFAEQDNATNAKFAEQDNAMVKHENGFIKSPGSVHGVVGAWFEDPVFCDYGEAKLSGDNVYLNPNLGPVSGTFGFGKSQHTSNKDRTVPIVEYHDLLNEVHNYYEFPIKSGGTIALTSDITAVTSDITAVTSRVVDNETNITKLETDISDLEQRLSNMGFKSGTVTVSSGTATDNIITRQGNYCILSLVITGLSGVNLTVSNKVLGTVSKEFRPKENITFYTRFTGLHLQTGVVGYATITINTNGEIILTGVSASQTSGYVQNVTILNVGYEAAPL